MEMRIFLQRLPLLAGTMYKSSTLTHRELAVFVAVVVVVFVLFFAPNFAVIEKIRKDVEELTIEDEADHLPHKYCATMDQVGL